MEDKIKRNLGLLIMTISSIYFLGAAIYFLILGLGL